MGTNIDQGFYEYGVNVNMIEAVKNMMIYTKVVEITPKYIIINKCSSSIEIM